MEPAPSVARPPVSMQKSTGCSEPELESVTDLAEAMQLMSGARTTLTRYADNLAAGLSS